MTTLKFLFSDCFNVFLLWSFNYLYSVFLFNCLYDFSNASEYVMFECLCSETLPVCLFCHQFNVSFQRLFQCLFTLLLHYLYSVSLFNCLYYSSSSSEYIIFECVCSETLLVSLLYLQFNVSFQRLFQCLYSMILQLSLFSVSVQLSVQCVSSVWTHILSDVKTQADLLLCIEEK